MHSMESWPADAEAIINAVVMDRDDSTNILSGLQEVKEEMEAGERATVDRYIVAMRPVYAGMMVDDLEGNTAGLYDGSSIFVDRSVLLVDQSVELTIAQSCEVLRHENYHLENDHTAPLVVMAETKGDIAAVIGGVEFTETALIEGLTVKQTGDQFVSEEYLEYENMIDRAMANAHLTVGNFEEAVNEKKNVAAIDDRHLVPEQIAM